MKIRNLIIASMLVLGTANAADKFTASGKLMLNYAPKFESKIEKLQGNKVAFPYSIQNNKLTVSLSLRCEGENIKQKLEAVGCKVKVNTRSIYMVEVPVENIEKLNSLDVVKSIETTGKVTTSLDESLKLCNGENVVNHIGNESLLAGEGVVVGIVDTGIDYLHPDFSDENGSRVLYYWNMMEDKASRYPEGYEWGSEYTKADIDNKTAPETGFVDIIGHGTHCTGVAAGGGKAEAKYRGIAYKSDIIAVSCIRLDDMSGMSNENIIAGCQYIIDKAKALGKPVVINLSLGSLIDGGHDGTEVISQALNEMSEPGVLFSVAMGNDGQYPIHAGGKLTKGGSVCIPIFPTDVSAMEFIEFPDPEYSNNPDLQYTAADIWYDAGVADSIHLNSWDLTELVMAGMSGVMPTPKATYSFSVNDPDIANQVIMNEDGTEAMHLMLTQNPDDPLSHAGNAKLILHNAADNSIEFDARVWTIETTAKADGYFDVWAGMPVTQDMLPFPISLPGKEIYWGDYNILISSPANADSAISVGSIVSKTAWINYENRNIDLSDQAIGELSDFSSKGPRRDRKSVPIISAPGQYVAAPLSSNVLPEQMEGNQDYILPGNQYVLFQGTSMATPHVTGALALMLQVNPKLTTKEAMEILQASATKDAQTGEVPNYSFGGGKLNIQNAINYMLGASAKDYVMANDVKVFPLPAQNELNITLENSAIGENSLAVYNEAGVNVNVNYSISGNNLKLNVANLASGVYVGEFRQANSLSRFKFLVK